MTLQSLKYTWFYPVPLLLIFLSLLIGPSQSLNAWDYVLWCVQFLFGTPYYDAEQFLLMQ
ncbi:iron ABC transporter permease, partial [Acinetobacter variabilis]